MLDEPKQEPAVARTRSSDLDPKDPTDQKVRKWMKRITYIAGGLSAIILPLALLFNDVKDTISFKAQQVDNKTTAGYEVMAKAVNEIQSILTKNNIWAKQVEGDKLKLMQANKDLESRVVKLEAYVDMLIQQNAALRHSRDSRIRNPNAFVKKDTVQPTAVSKLPEQPQAPAPVDIKQAEQISPK